MLEVAEIELRVQQAHIIGEQDSQKCLWLFEDRTARDVLIQLLL